jgi:putative ABC transport system substrate-binding protein
VVTLSRRHVLRGVLAGAPFVMLASPALGRRTARVAILDTGTDSGNFRTRPVWQAFLRGLGEAGYVEKQNVTVDMYFADGKNERFADFAAAAVAAKADVIVAHSTPAARAAMAATPSIPIIAANISDPVAAGLVSNLAKPGGTVTGVANQSSDLIGKFFQHLTQIVPGLRRVGFLVNPTNHGHVRHVREMGEAGARLGVTTYPVEVRTAEDLDPAFAGLARQDIRGLVVFGDSLIGRNAARIVRLAREHRIVTIYQFALFADAGGLMSYGPRLTHIFYRAGVLAGRVLNGAKAGDLPFEQPSEFDLVVNLRAAKAIGIEIPPAMLLSASRVIE